LVEDNLHIVQEFSAKIIQMEPTIFLSAKIIQMEPTIFLTL